jgi:hypothetical protein
VSAQNETTHPDGRVELIDTRRVEASPLYNHDLAPVPVSGRNWTTYNYAALWISMAHCIPTYMLAAGLMSTGMSWWQALVTILLGNTIVLIPILLNSHPGTKYGIPFPVFARAAYGTLGSNLPALMRALVACGWFGIQAWIGGEALHTLFTSLVPGWPALLGAGFAGHAATEWLSFLLFWALNIAIIYRGKILLNGTLDELKRIVLGPVEYEAIFARDFDAGELDLPQGVSLAARSAKSLRFRIESPQAVNPTLVHALTARNAPLVSFQEVPRKLEHVYLKTMADAQGVTYAA